MRKNITYCLLTATILLFGSCSDYLDQVPEDLMNYDKIFETRASTRSYLATVYAFVPDEFDQRYVNADKQTTPGPWTAGCDESDYVWGFVGSQEVNTGKINSETEFIGKYWYKYYKGINTATSFIQNVHKCKELDKNDESRKLRAQWIAEAKAMRAIYYYYLMRVYGPVPMMGDRLIPNGASLAEVQLPRATVDECVKFIVSQLGEARNEGLLDNIKTSGNINDKDVGIGHIDKAIARAFQVETLMLAASPLFTGDHPYFASIKNNDGTYIFPQGLSDTEKSARWKMAADTAKAFIDEYVGKGYDLHKVYTNGVLDPYLSYREAVRGYKSELSSDKESIFVRMISSPQVTQYDRTPYHNGADDAYHGGGGLGATQEMVDAYFMANGLLPILGYEDDDITPIVNPDAGYVETGYSKNDYKDSKTGQLYAPKNVLNMWVNREPRFYADITFSGQKWLAGGLTSYLNYTGNCGKKTGGNDFSTTGYVVRKSAPLGHRDNKDRVNILLRLGQLYLNYVEALNEYNPGHPDVLIYLNLIRERAGIPLYGAGSGQIVPPTDKAEMRKLIHAERRVELSFENARYFDVRRWCTAEKSQGKMITGMNVDADGANFYRRTKVEDRYFEARSYFFPIPKKDVDIDKELVQNPGW